MSENFEFDCANWHVNTSELSCAPQTFGNESAYNRSNQRGYRRNNMWRGKIILNPLRSWVRVDFEGWLAGLDGTRNTFDLCICDPHALKLEGKTRLEQLELAGYDISKLCGPDADGEYSLAFSDSTCFADGTGFYIAPYEAAGVAAAASEGATTITMNGAAGFLRRGVKFSTTDNYTHIITKISGSEVSFRPHLRRDLAFGEALNTETPKMRVRLSADNSGTPSIKFSKYTDEITLDVIEVLKR